MSQTRLSGEMAVGGPGMGRRRGWKGKEFGRIMEPFSRICKEETPEDEGDICKCHHVLHLPSYSEYLPSDD